MTCFFFDRIILRTIVVLFVKILNGGKYDNNLLKTVVCLVALVAAAAMHGANCMERNPTHNLKNIKNQNTNNMNRQNANHINNNQIHALIQSDRYQSLRQTVYMSPDEYQGMAKILNISNYKNVLEFANLLDLNTLTKLNDYIDEINNKKI